MIKEEKLHEKFDAFTSMEREELDEVYQKSQNRFPTLSAYGYQCFEQGEIDGVSCPGSVAEFAYSSVSFLFFLTESKINSNEDALFASHSHALSAIEDYMQSEGAEEEKAFQKFLKASKEPILLEFLADEVFTAAEDERIEEGWDIYLLIIFFTLIDRLF